jgi:hypothetical protein
MKLLLHGGNMKSYSYKVPTPSPYIPLPETSLQFYSKDKREFIEFSSDPYALMDEVAAAAFLNLTRRGLQNFRFTGNGPKFVKISNRCIKYRRIDLIEWSSGKLKNSTSEGQEDV